MKIEVLAANNNDELLEQQINGFKPAMAILHNKEAYEKLKARYVGETKLYYGEEGLIDKRGRHKLDDEVDELERLRRENVRLKRQLEEKDMAVELLKKVKEFGRM